MKYVFHRFLRCVFEGAQFWEEMVNAFGMLCIHSIRIYIYMLECWLLRFDDGVQCFIPGF
jgi:hypothetical protein